jgi:hypothetical protein
MMLFEVRPWDDTPIVTRSTDIQDVNPAMRLMCSFDHLPQWT